MQFSKISFFPNYLINYCTFSGIKVVFLINNARSYAYPGILRKLLCKFKSTRLNSIIIGGTYGENSSQVRTEIILQYNFDTASTSLKFRPRKSTIISDKIMSKRHHSL